MLRGVWLVVGVSLWSARVDPAQALTRVDPARATNTTDQTDQRITQLEAAKRDLLQQIEDALADELVAQRVIDELNLTRQLDSGDNATPPSEDGRRRLFQSPDPNTSPRDERYFDPEKLYSKQERKSKHWDERVRNKEQMQAQLDQWLADREAEKHKIKVYKAKTYKMKEHCPREGFRKPKDLRRSGSKKKKKNKGDERGHKYPCCRKCCKRSYMGCL